MSYTTGGQTIDKSMNGLIVFDTGGGVVIEGDSITADGTITCNDLNVSGLGTFTNLPTSPATTSDTLFQLINRTIANIFYARLASPNIFTSTNSFNNFLPTSIITDTSDLFAFINRTIANVYYAQLGTANTFLGLNTFNTILPSSTLGVTTNNNELINKNIGNAVYPQLTGTNTISANNTFTGTNTFDTNLPSSTLGVTTNNNELINKNIGNAVYPQLTGTNTISANNTFTGTNTFDTNLPSSTLGVTTNNNELINKNIGNAVYPQLTGTNTISANNTFTGTNTFDTNLPSSTLGVTTSNNELINKTIGNAVYPQLSQDNTFAGNNKFTQLSTDSTISLNQNISGVTISPPFRITSTGSSNTLNFNANTTGYNGLITNGDCAIYSSPQNASALTLTTHATGSVGVRITPTDVRIVGTTTSLDGTTTNVTGACAFTALPTCTVTTTTNNNELINKNIGNAVYSQLGTTNTFTSLNTFQGGIDVTGTTANIRPTGTLNLGDTAVTTAINMGNQVNTVTNNIFGQTINLGDDVNATINLLSRTLNLGDVFGGTTTIKSPNINLGSGSFGGTVTVGLDNASHITDIISRAITVGTTRAGTTTSIVSPSVSVTGSATFNTTLPSSTLGVTTSDNELINKTIGNAHYSRLASANAFSSTNSFDNFLPTSSITTNTDNTALINKNIGNTHYARLSNNNTFSGLQNILSTGSLVCAGSVSFTKQQAVAFAVLPECNASSASIGSQFITKTIGDSFYSRLTENNTFSGTNSFTGVVNLIKITPLYTTIPAYTSADVGFIHTFSATNGDVINDTITTYITTSTIPKGVYTFFVRGSVATNSTSLIRTNVSLKVTTGAVLLIQAPAESTNLYSNPANYSIPYLNSTDQTFILTGNRTSGTTGTTSFVNAGERLTYIKILRIG